MMNLSLTKKYFGIAIILSLVICITIHFPLVLDVIFGDEGGRGGYGGHRKVTFDAALALLEFFNTFIVSLLIFTLNFFLLKPFSRHQKMTIQTVALAVFLTFLSVSFLGLIFNIIKPNFVTEVYNYRHHDELLFQNFFSSALVLASIFIIRLIYQKQTYELETKN